MPVDPERMLGDLWALQFGWHTRKEDADGADLAFAL